MLIFPFPSPLPSPILLLLIPSPLCAADFLFKFLVIGNAGTGKSCLLHQFIENKCKRAYTESINPFYFFSSCSAQRCRVSSRMTMWSDECDPSAMQCPPIRGGLRTSAGACLFMYRMPVRPYTSKHSHCRPQILTIHPPTSPSRLNPLPCRPALSQIHVLHLKSQIRILTHNRSRVWLKGY